MEIYINNNQDKVEVNENECLDFINKLGNLLNIDSVTELSVTFVDNNEIRRLNKEFRAKDYETDVLSFPFENIDLIPVKILGDIIISLEKAVRQAEEYNHSFQRELYFLITHGLLHLMGYDHKTPEQETEMFDLQQDLLYKLKIFR